MPVDEFGREIPAAAAARRDPSPPPYRAMPPRPVSPVAAGQPPHYHYVSPPPPYRNNRPSPRYRQQSHASTAGAVVAVARPLIPPSEKYVKEPMLCEVLWKEEQNSKNSTGETSVVANESSNKAEETTDSGDAANSTSETITAARNNGDNNATTTSYDDYVKQYCLRYVRSFFNKHLDDSWFRQAYSPLERYDYLENVEHGRSRREAQIMFEQARKSSQSSSSGAAADNNNATVPDFIIQARLGGGHKEGVTLMPTSHVVNSIPKHALQLFQVPHFVTDEQITQTLLEPVLLQKSAAFSSADLHVMATTPRLPLMTRHLLITGKDNALAAIWQARQHNVVPRKEGGAALMEIIVDCSDPYSRTEVDANGQGAAPDHGLGVSRQTCTLTCGLFPAPPPSLQVLTAALSASSRIVADQEAATTIAAALDQGANIPSEHQLTSLLAVLPSDLPAADTLDVAVAYLRRVHWFSFYGGCVRTERTADVVLSGKSPPPVATVHVRLENADHELGVLEPKEPTQVVTKDLLVQRLDDAIAQALQDCATWKQGHAALQQQAKHIRQAEADAEATWLDAHSRDEDGRARCSFHFCHKLFKDSTFLRKHLLKKHVEFLRAEQAKAHDPFMMEAWDAAVTRPVPDILVQCGSNFGKVRAPVRGGPTPYAQDPEPELWRKEDEKRAAHEMMRKQREEKREQHQQHRDTDGVGGRRMGGGGGFVDVDDMQEEKIELKFDNIDVPVMKKKKKRKLL